LDQISDFGSNGVTVGGGLEKKLSPKWSLRAEYRYTHFGKDSFSNKAHEEYATSSSGSGGYSYSDVGNGGYTGSSSSADSDTNRYTSNISSSGHFDNDLQIGRIGIKRYFMTGN
jgi:opacity protein-like surface antigen